MPLPNAAFEEFLTFSSLVTGFSRYRLLGTGEAEEFFTALGRWLGQAVFTEFLGAVHAVRAEAGADEGQLERLLRARVFGHEKYGPVARNVIKLWYVGVWYKLPDSWHAQYGAGCGGDRDQIVSTAAYTEALLWPAIGANPPGAKGPGFGTWAEPPRIPLY